MPHETYQEWIALAHDGLLPDESRRALEAHLLECAACRSYQVRYTAAEIALQRELSAAHPRPSVSPTAIRKVLTRARTSAALRIAGHAFRSVSWAALTIGAVVGLSWVFSNTTFSRPEPAARPTNIAAASSTPISLTAPERAVSPGGATTSPDLRLVLADSSAPISDLAISPNGETIAAGNSDGTVYIWRLHDGALLQTFTSQEKETSSLAFSPDGKYLVTGGRNGEVNVFLARTGVYIRTLLTGSAQVRGLRFSPGGDLIAITLSNYSVALVRLSDGQPLEIFESAIRMDVNQPPERNGVLIASAENAIWLESDDETPFNINIQGQNGKSLDVAYSAGRSLLASASTDGLVYLWKVFDISIEDEDPLLHTPRTFRTITGNLLRTLSGHDGWVTSLAFDSDSRLLVSGGEDGSVILWDVDNGAPLVSLTGHTGAVNAVDIDPLDRWIVSGSDDHTVRIWNLAESP